MSLTCGGAKGTRTPGLLDANQTLFQLSYSPEISSAKGTRYTGQTASLTGRAPSYFSSLDSRRSAKGLPPVWQVGQYWSAESAKDTSLMVSPQTAHSWPARPCTRRPLFFSPFRSAAARPAERSTASVKVVLIASYRVATSSGVMLAAILKGDI